MLYSQENEQKERRVVLPLIDPKPSHLLYSDCPDVDLGAFAEIDLAALRYNFRLIRRRVSPATPVSVVKAEAYGHGAAAVIRALVSEGCDHFAVASLREALEAEAVLRSLGAKGEIMILGFSDPAEAALLAKKALIRTVLSEADALALQEQAARAGVTVRVQVALDTGMHRIGLPLTEGEEATANALARILRLPNLHTVGLFSHLARADEPADGAGGTRTTEQIALFDRFLSLLKARGISLPTIHLFNSAASLTRPPRAGEWVRVGLALYGVSPAEEASLPLRPVMRLVSRVVHLQQLKAGDEVGYGGRYVAPSDRTVATISIGYADGLPQPRRGIRVELQTGSGSVLCPLIGRVCMDQCMVDVTGTDVRVGDRVVLFGSEATPLSAYAFGAELSAYECFALVSGRVRRFHFNSTPEVSAT